MKDTLGFKKLMLFESNILVACFNDIEFVLSKGIKDSHFSDDTNKKVFRYLCDQNTKGVDLKAPSKQMIVLFGSSQNPPDEFKRLMWLYENKTKLKADVNECADNILAWNRWLKIRENCQHLDKRIETWDWSEPANEIENLLGDIDKTIEDSSDINFLPDYASEYIDQLKQDAANPSRIELISTNISEINRCIGGGLRKGCLYTIAARTGCGKTALATNLTLAAAKQGYYSMYTTIEMDKQKITDRFHATVAEVETEKFLNRIFTKEEVNKIVTANEKLKEFPIFIEWKSNGNWSEVEKAIRKHKRKTGLSFVVVDYIQQFRPQVNMGKDRRLELDYMTSRLKHIAVELNLVAVMCAQVNREAEKQSRDPILSDIKESSGIEQDSDVVLMLYATNDEAVLNGGDKERLISCKIAKNRHGGLANRELKSKLSLNKFYF
jgi:replicative DNA helicase